MNSMAISSSKFHVKQAALQSTLTHRIPAVDNLLGQNEVGQIFNTTYFSIANFCKTSILT